MEEGVNPMKKCLQEKIEDGKDIIKRLDSMKHIDGVDKLIRKVFQEIKFLEKV